MSFAIAALSTVVCAHWLNKTIRRRNVRASIVIPPVSRTILLKVNLDEGLPGPEHFNITSQPTDTNVPPGGVLVQALVFSADPYLRGRIKTGRGMSPGSAMEGFIAGKVLVSRNPNWVAGDLFGAALPFSTVQVVTPEQFRQVPFWKLTDYVDEATISLGVGILGMPGATAYGGLIDVLRPKAGETIWVSGAAGAVGGLVGQLAKNVFGCRVVGSAGGGAKCNLVTNFYGFDECVDYKQATSATSLAAAVKAATKGGIDMYFENVGGTHFEAALACLKSHGRIAVCGSISGYNDKMPEPEKLHIFQLIYTFQRIEGFLSTPWLTGERGNFLVEMAGWLKAGKLKVEETTFDGVDKWPEAFQALFLGKNSGKVVVRV